ncbi:unnamed protein product [Alopecurus aequalis]
MCNQPAAAPAFVREPLPTDLLLEIFARCDVTTIIRCAMASKFLRRSILDPAFLCRLELQAAADGGGGFDPALLVGVSYQTYGPHLVRAHHIIHTPSSVQLHPRLLACSLRDSFEPVASRGRLLLLRRFCCFPEPANVELRVCDTTIGHRTSLPTPNVVVSHVHAFLRVGDAVAGGSYELFVMDKQFRFQTFSSKHGQRNVARQASVTLPLYLGTSSHSPVVITRTIYRLCHMNTWGGCSNGILALDIDGAEANAMDLPPGFSSRMMTFKMEKQLLLASVHGRLSLLAVENAGISMWTLTPASLLQPVTTWSRQLVIGAEEIASLGSPLSYVLEVFGERSGAVIVQVEKGKLLRLDLGTKVVTRLHCPGDASAMCLFLHETDLTSLLKKSF